MTVPFLRELDPLEELKMLRAQAGDDPLDQLKATKRRPVVRGAASDATRVNPTPDTGEPGTGSKMLGVLAVVGRDMGPVESAQAGIRALVRGQSYRDARNDIRSAEDAAPKIATIPARIAGGALAAAAIPGGPVLQGARYGALSGLTQSDPDASLKTRIDDAGLGMAVGAGGAYLAQNASRIPLRSIAKAIRSPRKAAVRAVGGILRDALGEANAPVAPLPQAAPDITPPPSVVDLATEATRHRTGAQFAEFARQAGRDVPQPAASLDAQLATLLRPLRAAQPAEVGASFGDAEEAMGLAPHQQPNLEDLLRRSLEAVQRARH